MKVFIEEQKFNKLWMYLLIGISCIGPLIIGFYGIIQQLFYKTPFGDNPMSNLGLIFFTFSMLVLTIFIFSIKLKTRIDEKGIYYQFFPIHLSYKLISWNEISKAGIRTYYPISEFGGWGLRGGFFFNKGKGKAINVSGNIGIQLELKDGEKLLIGTQKKAEVKRVLETYQNKNQ